MKNRLIPLCTLAGALLLINSAFLAGFPSATAFYIANIFLHVALGAFAGVVGVLAARLERRALWVPVAAVSGIVLAAIGNTQDHWRVLWLHVALSLAAVAILFARKRSVQLSRLSFSISGLLLTIWLCIHYLLPHPGSQIKNSLNVPTSMAEEGAGPKSPFFPSAANTDTGHVIPSGFFMESKKCGECHRDIYNEWKGSAHHFSSFNNQFYRKAIESMQHIVGTKPSKWCAGCHDHAMFFNGRFDRPAKEQIDTPEAQAGLSCMSCHSITHVHGTMGNGDFTITYPPLDAIANSSNPFVKDMEHFVTYAAPEPHRMTFMKRFMKNDTADFCSACHKVHLDVPVNGYRWLRGFNDYDNWQANGVSGQGARSFYYPDKAVDCASCHMPLTPSHDPGNVNGMIHSHRFLAANTAVAFANHDQVQEELTKEFLQSGFITVDIFALSPVETHTSDVRMVRRGGGAPQTQTSFAVGEEAEQSTAAVIKKVGAVAAPINQSGITVKPGETVRLDVVVRTRKIGHFFPGGTVDAPDVWLELQGKDDEGHTIFWSGKVEDNGKGPVEPGAHFYRSYQLDGAGNPINKRNSWQTRSVLYVHLIPPGAADVAHYLVSVPPNAKGQLHFTAKLNYRKFSWYYTQFAYAGVPKPGHSPTLVAADHDSREYSFDPKNIPANVSGAIKHQIPDIPIVTLAEDTVSIPVSQSAPVWRPVTSKDTRERWNDWGIGLLLQGDLKGAEYAFQNAAKAEPGYADAWLNTARALIQEGETDRAKPYIAQALKLNSSLGRIYYFKALIQKSDGDYDGALQSLLRAAAQYPRDRVVLNQIARIFFLKRDYKQALTYLDRVCDIDTEDVQMHYTAMLCYRGLGDEAKARHEELLFRRFKADEASQAITAQRRMISPEDNNERQLIHDHESIPLS